MPRLLRSPFLLAALALVTGCRDIALVSDLPEFEWPTGSPRSLTYNTGDDRNPTWSANGDSVYYSAQGYPGLPLGRGVLVAAPADGGTVRTLYAHLHETLRGAAYHVAPALSPDGRRIAFIDIVGEAAPEPCMVGSDPCPGIEPVLQRAHLSVRAVAQGSTGDMQTITVELPGRGSRGVAAPFEDRVYPYHALYAERRIAFTASWAPDNQRLVFSNGVQLFLWTPGAGVPAPIPNTEHGSHPEWSPDGERIAFMRMQPLDSTTTFCLCGSEVARGVLRTTYGNAPRVLELIAPDGTGRRVIGPGEDPTWAPDGSLYARRGGEIVRIDTVTATAVSITGTDYGAEPDVSPDGSRLVFTYAPATGGYDVWVVELAPQ